MRFRMIGLIGVGLLIIAGCGEEARIIQPPEHPPDMRGIVTAVNHNPTTGNIQITVEGERSSITGSTKIYVILNTKTSILKSDGEEFKQIPPNQALIGQTVTAYFQGPVFNANPPLATAELLIIH